MAATGYTPISLYYSTTASAVPTAGNLANGELALNIADMKLYAKNSAGAVTLLASNASTTGVDSLSFGSTGLTPSTATTGAITVAGTLNVANGGTGQTSFTANRLLYGNGTSALQSSANLQFNGTQATVLYSGASGATFGTNQAIRIDSNANVGYAIGVPSTGGIVGGYYVNGGANSYDGGFEYNGTTRTLFLRSAGSNNLILDSAGNLGLGVTPQTWSGSSKVFQIGATGAIRGRSDANLINLMNNFYTDSGGANKYIASDYASNYQQYQGQHQFYIAASGTAGASVTFVEALTLQNVSQQNLTLRGTNASMLINSTNGVYPSLFLQTSGTSFGQLGGDGTNVNIGATGYLALQAGGVGSEKARITTSGAWSFGSSGTNTGTAGQVLTSQGSGSAPTWAAAAGGSQAFVAFGSTGGY